jgi:catechol 2,3-dioxygenase-like lactoylglutathione lyase family enzyme
MEIKFHHINLVSDEPSEMGAFYRDVLGLEPMDLQMIPGVRPAARAARGSFVHDGQFQFHLAGRDPNLAFRMGQVVNPVVTGHIAFRTDDIEAVKERLRDSDIPFSDYGVWAVDGWHQIFFHDPAGHIVEIHQVVDESSPNA